MCCPTGIRRRRGVRSHLVRWAGLDKVRGLPYAEVSQRGPRSRACPARCGHRGMGDWLHAALAIRAGHGESALEPPTLDAVEVKVEVRLVDPIHEPADG